MDLLVMILGLILQQVIPAATIGVTIVVLLKTQAGQAFVRKLMGSNPDVSDLAALKEHVARLHEELVETQERLDFAERTLLASGRPGSQPTEPTPAEITPV